MRILAIILVLTSMTALTGCETVKGMGRDIGNMGRALDRTF